MALRKFTGIPAACNPSAVAFVPSATYNWAQKFVPWRKVPLKSDIFAEAPSVYVLNSTYWAQSGLNAPKPHNSSKTFSFFIPRLHYGFPTLDESDSLDWYQSTFSHTLTSVK